MLKASDLLVSRVEAVLKVIITLLRYSSIGDSQECCAEAGVSEYLGQTLKRCYYGHINCVMSLTSTASDIAQCCFTMS